MRIYNDKKEAGLVSVICNRCKKEFLAENGILKGECVHVSHDFGFFGQRDGETHSFDLCEECYAQIIKEFQIPVEIKERNELL